MRAIVAALFVAASLAGNVRAGELDFDSVKKSPAPLTVSATVVKATEMDTDSPAQSWCGRRWGWGGGWGGCGWRGGWGWGGGCGWGGGWGWRTASFCSPWVVSPGWGWGGCGWNGGWGWGGGWRGGWCW